MSDTFTIRRQVELLEKNLDVEKFNREQQYMDFKSTTVSPPPSLLYLYYFPIIFLNPYHIPII